MKQLALSVVFVVSTTIGAYSQGLVYVDNITANGYVVTSANPNTSSAVDGTYAAAPSFTAQLFGLPGNVQSASAYVNVNSFVNLLNISGATASQFTLAGSTFAAAGSTIAGGSSGSQAAGVFNDPVAHAVTGSPGLGSGAIGNPGSTVVALVAWTGSDTTFSAALTHWTAGSIYMGMIAFEQVLGAGGLNTSPDIAAGWTLINNSPNANANGGNQDLILTQNPVVVPEPSTLALAGLGGFGMLMAFRRKKA